MTTKAKQSKPNMIEVDAVLLVRVVAAAEAWSRDNQKHPNYKAVHEAVIIIGKQLDDYKYSEPEIS